MTLHSSGLLWAAWSGGASKYIIDAGRMNSPRDVFVYTLQEGVCETSSGCEVFPSVTVKQGEPIYKNYAVVSAPESDAVLIYDVTNPNALCTCSSGSGQTALLKSRVVDSGDLELDGPARLEYFRKGNKHYALVASGSGRWVPDH